MLLASSASLGQELVLGAGRPAGGGNPTVLARRDWPEILLPDNAAPVSHIAGAGDVLAAWQQAVSGAQFGPNSLVIVGIALGYRIGITTAAGVGGLFFTQRELRMEIGLGVPAAPPISIGRQKWSGATSVSVTNPAATTVVTALSTGVVHLPLGPHRGPPNGAVSVRAAVNDVNGNYNMSPVIIAYDPATINTFDTGLVITRYINGLTLAYSEHSDYVAVNSGGAAWVNGAWTTVTFNGGAVADADYLVVGITSENPAPVGFGSDINGDISTFAGGINTIQSRFAIPRPGGLFWPGPYHWEFPMPFHIATGETVQIRTRSGSGFVNTLEMALNLVRL